MSIPSREKLAELFAELRRIEEHRSTKGEKQIMKTYQEMLTDLRGFLGNEYAKYAEDDVLTYSILARKNQYARFLEEVQKEINIKAKDVNETITKTVTEMYDTAYKGMVNAVAVASNDVQLATMLSGVTLTSAQVIKAAVNNPVSKLTLSKTLEKNRKQIIYNIKSTITNGLMNGDRMSTMARKIQNDVDMNYRKAMLIARTEVHRVRETGHNDAANAIDNTLAEADSDYRMVKIWKSMRDEKVRKTNKADHRKMNGQVVLQEEDFELGRGVTAPCPGQSGTAYNDCNCRCYVSHDLMSDEEFFKATGRHFKKVEKPKKKTAEPNTAQISAENFPTAFNQKTAKKQTKKFVDYVNSIEGADRDMLNIYNNMGKMENIERNGIPFKISYTKSGHAVGYGYRGSTGALTEVKVKIPKLDGDNIAGAAQTTAHELGHYIDLLMRSDASRHGNWISTTKNMSRAINNNREGISDKVSALFKGSNLKCKELRESITQKYQKKIAEYKQKNADVIANVYSNYSAYQQYQKGLKKIYSECDEEIDYTIRNELNGVNSLQDIYDALSKGKYRDTGVVRYGHGSKYYRSEESQIHEIWANYCSLSLTRPDLIELLKQDKPELIEALEEIKAEVIKKVGDM